MQAHENSLVNLATFARGSGSVCRSGRPPFVVVICAGVSACDKATNVHGTIGDSCLGTACKHIVRVFPREVTCSPVSLAQCLHAPAWQWDAPSKPLATGLNRLQMK